MGDCLCLSLFLGMCVCVCVCGGGGGVRGCVCVYKDWLCAHGTGQVLCVCV